MSSLAKGTNSSIWCYLGVLSAVLFTPNVLSVPSPAVPAAPAPSLPGCPVAASGSPHVYLPGAPCFGAAWLTASPRLLRAVVSPFFSWSCSYTKALFFQWVEQVSFSFSWEGKEAADDQVEAETEICLLTLTLNVFDCKEAKESLSLSVATEEERVTPWQNSSVRVAGVLGFVFVDIRIFLLPSFNSTSWCQSEGFFFNAKEVKFCKIVVLRSGCKFIRWKEKHVFLCSEMKGWLFWARSHPRSLNRRSLFKGI